MKIIKVLKQVLCKHVFVPLKAVECGKDIYSVRYYIMRCEKCGKTIVW